MTTHALFRVPTNGRRRQLRKWEVWHAISMMLLSVLAMLVSACGGGGGGGGTSPPTIDPPVITSQPSSLTVASGASATFSVTAIGAGLAYQWQRSVRGEAFADISGASASAYTIAAVNAAMNGQQFRVVVQNPAEIVVSSAATLAVSGSGAATTSTVAAGGSHSLALRSDGSVLAWGANESGQLGIGSSALSTFMPTRVTLAGGVALSGVAAVSAGGWHTLALKPDGSVLAWGSNRYGQLGDGTAVSRNEAVAVRDTAGNAFGGVVQLSAGHDVSAAVKTDGTVWVWGWHPWLFVLPTLHPAPMLDSAGNRVGGAARVAVGTGFVLVLKSDGSLWTWGAVGGSDARRVRAVAVETAPGVPVTGIAGIAAGWAHALALASDGKVLSWGGGEIGRKASLSEAQIPGFVTDSAGVTVTGVSQVQAGEHFSVLKKTDGSLWSFGTNANAVLGAGSTNLFETFPVQVREAGGVPFGSVGDISIGRQHTLALRQDASVWGWGRNANEQLAKEVESTVDYFVPQPAVVLP